MWFFKKKEDKQNWNNLHSGLSQSFFKIKEDMNHLGKWVSHFKDKHDEHDEKHEHHIQRIEKHNQRIDLLEAKMDMIVKFMEQNQPIGSKTAEISLAQNMPELEIDELEEVSPAILDNLTNLQKTFLAQLHTLQYESSQRWISMKYLAQEIYPTKDYQSIRSMMSTYTEIMLELGLIDKRRKGRDTYISLTKKAQNSLPKKKKKIAKTAI